MGPEIGALQSDVAVSRKEKPMYVGVDLVKIDRWERILEKFPARAEKIFTAEEIAHCEKKGKKRAES